MARVLGSTYDLKSGPRALTCFSPTRLSAETAEGLQVRVLSNPVSDQFEVEIRGAEGQPLQLTLTKVSGKLVGSRQIGQANAIERSVFDVQQQPAGLLLLRITSGLKNKTIKVVKQ